jgi:hypothetical protein
MSLRSIVAFVLLVCPLAVLQAEWVTLTSADQPVTVTVPQSDGMSTVLDYTVNGYSQQQINIDGKTWTLLDKLRKESTIEEVGNPRLPRFCRSLVIPDEGVMDYQILSAEYVDFPNVDLAPSKGHLTRDVEPGNVPYTFSDVYRTDAFYPSKLVNLRDPYVVRDLRGMVVELNAFQYNPVQRILRVYTHVTVEVNRMAPGGENVLLRQKPLEKMDPQFHQLYRRHFVNYDDDRYPVLDESGGMLVICYDAFMPLMQYLVDWKNQKGIPTVMVPISQVGTTTTQVKEYIQNYYNTHDLTYVLLVGDAAQVPAYTTGSDPVYSLMGPSDWYPSIFVGRFSAETNSHVKTQLVRTMRYEKYPDPNADWFHLGFGTADLSGPCNPEAHDTDHITLIANNFLHWNYTQMDSVYMNWGTTEMITHYINMGRSVWNYAGHGSTTMFGPPNFSIYNVAYLVNDNRLPHIVTVACNVGQFHNTTCIAEALMRATNSANGAPTGAIGCYMSKISQTWFPPYDMQDEGVDLLCADSMLTLGGYCFNGSGLMIDNFGSQGENEFKNWNIFGDPSLMIRTLTPYPLTVTHDSTLQVGDSTFAVTVMNSGNPQPGAMVCGMNADIYATGITNASGQVTLNFHPAPTQPGSFTLTVTTANSLPNIAPVSITPARDHQTEEKISNSQTLPGITSLNQNRPNPFNPTTAISYQLLVTSHVSLKVFDTAGRLVATLVDGAQAVGTHEVAFDGSRLPSGLYFLRMETGDFSAVQKMMLLK